jgi:hypothetical protein
MVVHAGELGGALLGDIVEGGGRELGVEQGIAVGHAVGDILPGFDIDLADHVQVDLHGLTVAVGHMVAFDDQLVGLAPFVDLVVEGHIVASRDLDRMNVGGDFASDLAVDRPVGDRIADTFGVTAGGGERGEAHGAPEYAAGLMNKGRPSLQQGLAVQTSPAAK